MTTAASPARRGPLSVAPAWLREPLLHFVLLGALLFAVDHVLVGRADDPRVIVVSREVEDQARLLFKSTRGRDPTAEEFEALRRVWIDNEVLYREGLALQVDKGDSAIRERVIFKALSVVDAGTQRPPVDDARLRAWFEQQRARYDEPARLDFQEAVPSDERTEATARALAARLSGGAPADVEASLRVFKARPRPNVVDGYGPDFAAALETAPPGEWRALRARDGWRVVQLQAIAAPRPASYEALRNVVLQDWTDSVMAEQRGAAVRALARKYTIRIESDV